MQKNRAGIVPFLVSFTVFATYFLITLLMSMPSTIVYGRDFGPRQQVNIFTSQTFGFFTKDPKSTDFLPLSNNPGDRGKSLLVTPQGRQSNWFGIRRDQRAQGPEMANIGNQLINKKITCEPDVNDCFRKAVMEPAIAIDNESPIPTLCGDIVMMIVDPVPFKYRNQMSTSLKSQAALHVDLKCNGSHA